MLFSCKKHNDKAGTFNGTETNIQHGKVWSWLKVDNNGAPQQLGISINDAALNGMPTSTGETGEGHHHENVVILSLDPLAKAITPFDHIEIDWNPAGHEPAGIYDKPHFDFHFYIMAGG